MKIRAHVPISALALLLSAGCATRPVSQVDPFLAANANYIDLEPGWRLRVVTPILRSGGYRLRGPEMDTSGNTLTMRAGNDFVGYEVAYYAIRGRRGSGLRPHFVSACTVADGRTTAQSHPRANLFHLPHGYRYLRLVSLTRSVNADHNQSLIAAKSKADLDTITNRINTDPAARCEISDRSLCVWIPQGISVQPETRRKVDGVGQWTPAR